MEITITRFIEAQKEAYAGYFQALNEINQGKKISHWIWYIFPQVKGLGHSNMANYYGIINNEEAKQYLAHEVLGARIREITKALLAHKGKKASDILGNIDAKKVRSCMTMFDCISPNDIFGLALDYFYEGKRCKFTLRFMQEV